MPTHRLLEGTDIAQLLAQVRDEHGEDAKIVRAERVRTGGIGGFFSREHYELAIEIDDDVAPAAATDEPSIKRPRKTADTQMDSGLDLFGATLNSEFKKSVTSNSVDEPAAKVVAPTIPDMIPDTVAELSAPVDSLVRSASSQEDTFIRSGSKPVRTFVPTKIDAATPVTNPGITETNDKETRVQSVENPAAKITPDVAQHILTAAAAAVAAAEATSRSLEATDVLAPESVIATSSVSAPGGTTTLARETMKQVTRPSVAPPVEVVEQRVRGRHSKGSAAVDAAYEPAHSDRAELQVPFMGLATTASDNVMALNSDVLTTISGFGSGPTPLATWLNCDDNSHVDQLPWPPRRPGEVLVLVGDAVAGLHAARDIARHTRLGSASVFVVAPDLLPELSAERRIANPSHARIRRAELAQSASASIIVIDAPLTMAGDPLAAEWVRDMVGALDATAVWAIVDATRRPKDVRRWMAAIGRVDGIVAHDVAATSEPGELLQLGAPVAYLDGVHATGAAWHSVNAHAQALDRNAYLMSTHDAATYPTRVAP